MVDGELVLYDPVRQRVHALNCTAAFIWQFCDGRHDTEEIVAALAERYPGNRASIEQDVQATLGLFLQQGLLQA
ncbi:MAG: PqqD family protein [Chloroflexota bacterium]